MKTKEGEKMVNTQRFYDLMSELLATLPADQKSVVDELEKIFIQLENYIQSVETDAAKWRKFKALLEA